MAGQPPPTGMQPVGPMGGPPPHMMGMAPAQQHIIQQQMAYQNQLQQQQQQPPQQQQRQQEDKLVSKARELMGPLKEKWNLTLREAANKIQIAGNPESSRNVDHCKFESNLEDFNALCDQMELNIKSAIDCINQTNSSNRYMPIQPLPSRLETAAPGNPGEPPFLSYPQYIATSKQQIGFANDVKQLLNQAAQDVLEQKY